MFYPIFSFIYFLHIYTLFTFSIVFIYIFLFIFIIIYNVLLYAMLCIYNIIHISFFFLTHVPGRLAIMLHVYCVKIVSASVHTSRRICVHMSISTVRARSTRLRLLSFPLYVYMCDLCIVALCVRRHASLQITLYIIRLPLPTWRFRATFRAP